MRDIALLLFFIACVPFMLRRPALGIVMWIWLSVMNPHRLALGFAHDMQFAAATAIITFVALIFTKDERRLEFTPPVIALSLFMLWICLASLFPYHTGAGFDMWLRVMKILLMTLVAVAVIHSKQQIHWVIWTIVLSLGYYGAKGGFFTGVTGGGYLVWGPEGSFIEGNNEVALALVMVIPLMRYVQLGLKQKWARWGMIAVMLLTALAAMGSHSRGALVAIAAMAAFMWWKSRSKVFVGIALVLGGFAILSFMPAEWFQRMETIQTYDADASAMGRINAWHMAFNLASDRFFGGGFDIYDSDVFSHYAPNPLDIHAAHSIYFMVLGEHGFIGLILFVSIGACTWFAASDGKRKAKGIPGLEWIPTLMDLMKVSMIGYGVGGAFLSLSYFDVPYYTIVIVVAARAIAVAAHKPKAFVARSDDMTRRQRFGTVILDDEAVEAQEPPSAGPRGDDRRRPGFPARPAIGFETAKAGK